MTSRAMPDGVVELFYSAMAVSADTKSANTARKAAACRAPKYFTTGISGSPKPTKWDRDRARLLAAVRRGDPIAIAELRDTYHAWIVPRSATT